MAKRRSREVVRSRPKRDRVRIAKRSLLRPRPLPLSSYEDRRLFHPGVRPAASFREPRHRLVSHPEIPVLASTGSAGRSRSFSMSKIGFKAPSSVLICVRRKERREVLHARGVAGGKVSRRRRRGPYSEIVCRRV